MNAIEIVRSCAPFARLTEAELVGVLDGMEWVELDEGQDLFAEGDRGESMFVIVGGSVDVLKNGESIARLDSGSAVGEIALLTPENVRTASVRACGATVLLRWAAVDFRARIDAEDVAAMKVGWALAHQLAEHVQRMNEGALRARRDAIASRSSEFDVFRRQMLDAGIV